MTRRNADLIAEKLHAAGCRFAYGIPGGEVLTIMDALHQAGIHFRLTKHENFAGFMAEGSWHATGAPGILVATIGPGVANAVNVVANAYQDRVPLLVITGCLDDADADTYTHQLFDHRAVFKDIVKATFKATGQSLDRVLDKAITEMTSGQPGPVHLDLPIKVADAAAAAPTAPPPPAAAPAVAAASTTLEQARAMLASAQKPIVVAGVDALNDGAADALKVFIAATGAPLITTYKAKGMVPESDPLVLGGAGLSPLADTHLLPLLQGADCIILAGYDPIEMRVGWRNPWPQEAPVIDLTPVLRTHGMHDVAVTLMGSVGHNLAVLAKDHERRDVWAGGEPAAARTALERDFAPEREGWGPATAFRTLNRVLPKNTVITADSGAHRILLSQMWHAEAPREILQSSALCTMGCAVALAAGYKEAAPQRNVTAFVGDAGLEMTLGDLATVRDLGLSVPIVVLIDDSLALIEMKQRGSQLPNVGVDFSGTDFVKVAEGIGGHGVWIDDVETLEREATAALNRETFTLLCVRIGRKAYDGKF